VKPPTPHPFEGDTAARYDGRTVDIRWPEEWKTRPGWRPYNPSLAWHDGHLYVSVRYSFFAFPGIDTTGQVLVSSNYYGRSETLLAELNPTTMQIIRWSKLEYLDWEGSRNTALEDVRLYSEGGHLYGIGVFLTLDGSPHAQAIIDIDPDGWTARLIDVLPGERVEKNWSPIEGRTGFAYSPTQHVTRGGTITGTPYTGPIHGGTQLIEHGDGYLSVVHSFETRPYRRPNHRGNRRGRHYYHYWAFWDRDIRITHLSSPFVFAGESAIEFAAGLTRHGDRLLVSFGWGDWDLTVMSFDPITVDAALEPWSPR